MFMYTIEINISYTHPRNIRRTEKVLPIIYNTCKNELNLKHL